MTYLNTIKMALITICLAYSSLAAADSEKLLEVNFERAPASDSEPLRSESYSQLAQLIDTAIEDRLQQANDLETISEK